MNSSLSLLGALQGVRLAAVKAEFDEGLSFEEWLDRGLVLCRVGEASMWWIGAWLNAGNRMFLPQLKEGEERKLSQEELVAVSKYAKAMELTGYENQTLRRAAYVDRRVSVLRRRNDLSWSHHAEVAHLEDKDQGFFLKKAAAEKWTRSQLRQAIRKQLAVEREDGTADGAMAFVLSKQVGDIVRWFGVQMQAQPIDDMPPARRTALRRELQPIVDVYNALAPAPTPRKESISTVLRSR